MALLTNTFEGGTDNTGITTGNSGGASGTAFLAVTPGAGGTINFETTGAYRGTLSGEFTQSTAATLCHVSMSDTAASSGAYRFYIYLTGLPSVEMQFPSAYRTSADANLLALQMTSGGLLRGTSTPGGNLTPLGTNALSTGTWYRIETQCTGLNGTSGTYNVQAFVGDSTTPYESLAFTNVNTNALAQRVRYGKSSTATLASWRIDDIAQNIGSSTALGPSATPPPAGSLTWGYTVKIG